MNRILLFVTIFSFGYMFNDVLKEFDLNLINEVSADVAGMDQFDLRRDRDFKKAVGYIVEDCEVRGYVDDGYLHSTSISC